MFASAVPRTAENGAPACGAQGNRYGMTDCLQVEHAALGTWRQELNPPALGEREDASLCRGRRQAGHGYVKNGGLDGFSRDCFGIEIFIPIFEPPISAGED